VRGLLQPLTHGPLHQMKDEIVGAQAGDVDAGVKPLEGSSKSLVRKTAASLLRLSTCAVQSGWRMAAARPVVKGFPVRGSIVSALKPKNTWAISTSQLDGSCFQRPQILDQAADFFLRVQVRLFDTCARGMPAEWASSV